MPISSPGLLPAIIINGMPSSDYFPLSNPALLDAREKPADVFLPKSGVTARYWIYSGQSPAPETVILVHGFRGDHHGLLPLAEQLRRYRVIAVDLPGFGRTEPLPAREHTVASYSDFIKEFIEVFYASVSPGKDHARYTLAGHSFGSLIVSHFAAQQPQNLEKLILINPIAASALAGPQKILTFLSLFYYRLAAKLPQKLGLALLRSPTITLFMSILMTKTRDPSLRRFVRDQHRRYFSGFANRDVVLQAFESSISETVSDVAEKISVPTLLLAGEDDEIASVACQKKLLRALPVAATLKILPQVGHLIHYEKAYEAAQAIDDFLSEGKTDDGAPRTLQDR